MKKRFKELLAFLLAAALFLGQWQGAVTAWASEETVAAVSTDEAAYETDETLTDKEQQSGAEEAAENAEAADESLEKTEAASGAEEAAESSSEEAASGNEATEERAGQNQLTESNEKVQMVFKDGMAQPIIDYSAVSDNYSNENSDILRFSVFVETDLDTDMDGNNDLVEAVVQVPRAAAEGDYKAPAIFEASPYFGGTDDIFKNWPEDPYCISKIFRYYDAEIEGFEEKALYSKGSERSPVSKISTLDWAGQQDISNWHYNYNVDGNEMGPFFGGTNYHDYYLIRGFAIVTSAGLGTHGSEGFETCGSKAECDAFKNIVEWINGKRTAYTDTTSNIQIKADWANGKVAMTGTSYDGTLAYEVATTGVDGLKTVVPVGAISSWYEYTNEGGQANYSNHSYQYYLGSSNASRFFGMSMNAPDHAVDDGFKATGKYAGKSALDLYLGLLFDMNNNESSLMGSWGNYWKEREFSTVSGINIPGLIVEGLQDWNVRPKQAYRMQQAFKNAKLLLHQDGHTYPENVKIKTNGDNERSYFEILNLWYSKYLCDQDHKIDEELAAVTVQSNEDMTFYSCDRWGSDDHMTISAGSSGEKKISRVPFRPSSTTESADSNKPRGMRSAEDMNYDINSFYNDLPGGSIMDAEDESSYNDTWIQPVYKDVTINGMPKVRLRIKADSVSDDMFIGAMLYDISDEEFDTYNIADSTLDTLLAHEEYFCTKEEEEYFKKESNRNAGYSRNLLSYKADKQYSHLITKGKVSLKCPSQNEIDSFDLKAAKHQTIEKDKYYEYDLYLNPTIYTVNAGHRLVLYLMGAADGMYSTVDCTLDRGKSGLDLPVVIPDGVSMEDITGFDDGITVKTDHRMEEKEENKRTEIRTETIEGTEVSKVTIETYSNKTEKDSKIWIKGIGDSYIWQGEPVTLDDEIRVYDGTSRLTLGTDYKLSYKNHKKVGDNATVTVKFIGDYKNNAAVKYTYSIEQAELSLSSDVVAEDEIYICENGKNQKPMPEIVYKDTNTEVPKKELTVTYKASDDDEEYSAIGEPGEYTVIIRAKNDRVNVKGEKTVKLTVLAEDDPRALSNANVTLSANKFVFTNDYITPEPTVIIKGINNDQPLPAEAISVNYANHFWPGTARIVIKAAVGNKLDLVGSTKKTFKIVKGRKITDSTPFSFNISYAYYTMGGGKPDVTVKDGDDTLTLGKDYTLRCSGNNKITDSAKVTIKGKGNYKGSVTREYSVLECSIAKLTFDIDDKFGDPDKEKSYMNPNVTITDVNGRKLKKNRDYTVGGQDDDYSYDKSTGKCSVWVIGKGKYNGSSLLTYNFMDKKNVSGNIAKARVKTKIANQKYSMGPVYLNNDDLYDVLMDSEGNVLTPDIDFKIYSYRNNKKAGTASVVLKGYGNYAGKKTLKFRITDGKKRDFLGWLVGNIFKK